MADKKEIEKIRLGILQQFGNNSIRTGSDIVKADYGRISTGSVEFDLKLGGGIPVGRMMQISGNKSTAKSSLTDHIVREAQKTKIEWTHVNREYKSGRETITEEKKKVDGLICAHLDVEGTKTVNWTGDTIGVDTSNWLYSQPSGIEEAFEMAHQMQKDGVHLIVIDSLDSLETQKVMDKEFGESSQMGQKPKLIGEYCRKVTLTNNALVREGKLPCTIIFINQVREKIGVMFGSNEYTPGGRGKDFYISVDVFLRRGDWIVQGTGVDKEIIGQVVRFKTEKNKTYKQQQSGSFDFYFEDTEGHKAGEIDNFKSVVMAGIEYGVIEKAGSWFKYKGENIGQGADNTVKILRGNPKKYNEIKNELFKEVQSELKIMGGK